MKRLVRASKKDSEDCKKLLRLMGVPYVEVTTRARCTRMCMYVSGSVSLCAVDNASSVCACVPSPIAMHTSHIPPLSLIPPTTTRLLLPRPPARPRRSARSWPRPTR